MARYIYSLLHNFLHISVEMRRASRFFILFFVAASILWLVMAYYVLAAADSGACDLSFAALYVPEMAKAAGISVFLAVLGGIIFDMQIRECEDG